ncbi:bleomycin resistance protein [Rossellomorea marisflavi]|uniref:bleomycin resistance protein n=1 Tax=Rossellomorea marisflavi TaxID=189381 RepID=UPI00203CD6A1|nr:VOC family protein [Rossellomorea marisflavi]MCM2590401.1 VOC family protein [Rossellomorea marisflavi]
MKTDLHDEILAMKSLDGPALVPELSVRDASVSTTFYTELLGFHIVYERQDEGFVYLSMGKASLMLEEVNGHWETGELVPPFGRGMNLQIMVDSIEPIFRRLKKEGVPLFREPFVSEYAAGAECFRQREFLVQDPDGYLLRFAQSL